MFICKWPRMDPNLSKGGQSCLRKKTHEISWVRLNYVYISLSYCFSIISTHCEIVIVFLKQWLHTFKPQYVQFLQQNWIKKKTSGRDYSIIWKVNYISIYKPDRWCLLTFLPGKQNALFMIVRIRGWQVLGILPGNGNTACFNFITKNKGFLLFNRTFKGWPHGHSSNFFETTNKRNSLRPFHEKQKENTFFCKN